MFGGWRIADGDSADLAAELITRICREGSLDPHGLVLHSADDGKGIATQERERLERLRSGSTEAMLQELQAVVESSHPAILSHRFGS